jgi:hypothetical protein
MSIVCFKCEIEIPMSTPIHDNKWALCYDCAMDKAGY